MKRIALFALVLSVTGCLGVEEPPGSEGPPGPEEPPSQPAPPEDPMARFVGTWKGPLMNASEYVGYMGNHEIALTIVQVDGQLRIEQFCDGSKIPVTVIDGEAVWAGSVRCGYPTLSCFSAAITYSDVRMRVRDDGSLGVTLKSSLWQCNGHKSVPDTFFTGWR